MENTKKYTKREKEIIDLIDKVILKLKNQKDVWAKLFKEFKISDEELDNIIKEKIEPD